MGFPTGEPFMQYNAMGYMHIFMFLFCFRCTSLVHIAKLVAKLFWAIYDSGMRFLPHARMPDKDGETQMEGLFDHWIRDVVLNQQWGGATGYIPPISTVRKERSLRLRYTQKSNIDIQKLPFSKGPVTGFPRLPSFWGPKTAVKTFGGVRKLPQTAGNSHLRCRLASNKGGIVSFPFFLTWPMAKL